MRPGPGLKVVVAAAEAADMVEADTVAEETAAAVVVTVVAVDMVTSAAVAETVADGVADARNLLLEDFGCQDSEYITFWS